MERDKINELLGIALTSKEIQFAFKKYVSNLSVDIPAESIGILLIIHHFDTDVIQQEIAEVARKDKSSVLRQIDTLEKKNLVQRVVDPNDRRRNIVKITENGIRLIDEINIKLDELFSLLSEGLTTSDIETFNNVLNHLRNKAARML